MRAFWDWYNRHYAVNISITAFLFLLQIIHLFWLTTHVVALKIFGEAYFTPGAFAQWLIILVDYTEIPALIATSLVYINDLRTGASSVKAWLYLVMLNSQWLHIFWITDEFVLERFSPAAMIALPLWLAWLAIGIDYLELPVIFDTLKRAVIALRARRLGQFLKEDFRESA